MDKGLLISFEGIEGSGKTTQIEALASWLFARGISYVTTKEPGGTAVGKAIHNLLIAQSQELDALSEAFLALVDLNIHFNQVVLPALEAGKVVISDRCYDSNIVYQGIMMNVGQDFIENMSKIAMKGVKPDLTILLDISPEEVYNRRIAKGKDQFEHYSFSFYEHLRKAFLCHAKNNSKRIKIIDASKDIKALNEEIIDLMIPFLDHDVSKKQRSKIISRTRKSRFD